MTFGSTSAERRRGVLESPVVHFVLGNRLMVEVGAEGCTSSRWPTTSQGQARTVFHRALEHENLLVA